jgi:hypothetical protein
LPETKRLLQGSAAGRAAGGGGAAKAETEKSRRNPARAAAAIPKSPQNRRRLECGATELLLEIAMGQADPADGLSPIHSRLVKHLQRPERPDPIAPATKPHKETAQGPNGQTYVD